MQAAIANKYIDLETKLRQRAPDLVEFAHRLAADIEDPRTATTEQCWRHIWNKPLFANMKVATGLKWCDKIAPFMDKGWLTWGQPNGAVFRKVGRGISAEDFSAVTDDAKAVFEATRIPMSRLLGIQGAALAVKKRAEASDRPYADIFGKELRSTVAVIKSEMGRGWGDVTVLHFLTDMGSAVKPDIHVKRTVEHLWGSVAGDDYEINQLIADLVVKMDGKLTPSRLRYVDKVLMEISRQGVLPS